MGKKPYTFRLSIEMVDKMKEEIAKHRPRFSSYSHFIEVAIDELLKKLDSK